MLKRRQSHLTDGRKRAGQKISEVETTPSEGEAWTCSQRERCTQVHAEEQGQVRAAGAPATQTSAGGGLFPHSQAETGRCRGAGPQRPSKAMSPADVVKRTSSHICS